MQSQLLPNSRDRQLTSTPSVPVQLTFQGSKKVSQQMTFQLWQANRVRRLVQDLSIYLSLPATTLNKKQKEEASDGKMKNLIALSSHAWSSTAIRLWRPLRLRRGQGSHLPVSSAMAGAEHRRFHTRPIWIHRRSRTKQRGAKLRRCSSSRSA